MSGKISTCTACGGEYHAQLYDAGKYTFSGGWCDNCQRPVVQIPSKAYEDDDYDVESYSFEIADRIRKSTFKSYLIQDTPEFQFIHTERPTCEKHCQSCVHSYEVVKDGEHMGTACHKYPECKARFNVYVRQDIDEEHPCEDYEPRDTWHGMGKECRYCHHSCKQNGKPWCSIHDKDFTQIDRYERGHCKDLITNDWWYFEKIGFTECPECHGKAVIWHDGKKVKCHCGYRGSLTDDPFFKEYD